MSSRRIFIRLLFAPVGLTCLPFAFAEPQPLDEADPHAKELGYTRDASSVNPAAYPKYAVGQTCANCKLFRAEPSGSVGSCMLFPGTLVASAGWCNAWVKTSK